MNAISPLSSFPPGATVGQTVTINGITYVYDGTKWAISTSSGVGNAILVDQFGAKGDCVFFSGTMTVGAGSNPVVTIAGASLAGVSVGQLAVLPIGGGSDGSSGLKGTITNVNAAASQITITPLAGFTPFAVSNVAWQATGNPTVAAAGTGVTPQDVYQLVGGSLLKAGQITVVTTTVVSMVLNTAGTGGTPGGTFTFVGTSSGCPEFRFTANILSTGAIDPASISFNPATQGGVYRANPLSLTAEPVADIAGQSTGLTGATVTIVMGANNVQLESQPASISVATTPGAYYSTPANPVTTTGPILPSWQASNGYRTFDRISAVSGGVTYAFVCTTPGTSGGTTPAWPSSGTVTDGGVTWTWQTQVSGNTPPQFNVTWAAPQVVMGTDSAPGINQALGQLRSLTTPSGGRSTVSSVLLFGSNNQTYLVNGPLNFTQLAQVEVNGQRATIHSVGNGKPVFDALATQFVEFKNLTIQGNQTFQPRWSFQYGVIQSGEIAAYQKFDRIICTGFFSDAIFDYNTGSEACEIGTVRTNASAPYCRIMDGCNSSYWNLASDFTTITLSHDVNRTFQGGPMNHGGFINVHPNGCGVWMLGGTNHLYTQSSYIAVQQHAFWIVASNLVPTIGLKALCHYEVARSVVHFAPPPALTLDGLFHFNKTPSLSYLELGSDASMSMQEQVFSADPQIVHVYLRNLRMTLAFGVGPSTTNYYDNPAIYTASFDIMGGDGTGGRWSNNVPDDATGRFMSVADTTGQSPGLMYYGLNTADDMNVGGGLQIGGITQAFNTVLVSNGSVAGVAMTYPGGYQNVAGSVDYPTVTAGAPPAGGTQALLVVSAMSWFATGAILTPGTGYAKGDRFTIVGGTFTDQATGEVTSVNATGGVLTYAGLTGGHYSAYPPTTASTTTSGAGTGFTLNPLLWGVRQDGTGVTATVPGSGYTGLPAIAFSTPLSGKPKARGVALMGTASSMGATQVTCNVPVMLAADPTSNLQASTKQYVDAHAGAGGISDVPNDGNAYLRQFGTWANQGNIQGSNFEFGPQGTLAASAVNFDFHTTSGTNDYDARILVQGGTAGTIGLGQMFLSGSTISANGAFRVGGASVNHLFINAGTSTSAPITFTQDGTGGISITPITTHAGSVTFSGGATFGSTNAASVTNLTNHIALFGTNTGFSVTSGRLNIVAPSGTAMMFNYNGNDQVQIGGGGQAMMVGTNTYSSPALVVNGNTGFSRSINLQSAGSNRWQFQASSLPETGSDAGSDFNLVRCHDAGTTIDAPINVVRSTGVVTIGSGGLIVPQAAGIGAGASGPTIHWGSGVPSGTQPKSSVFIRTDGTTGAMIYVNQGGTVWNAIAGV